MKIYSLSLTAVVMFSTLVHADALRGTLVHESLIRVAPDKESAKLGTAGRGHELVILETTHDWTRVEAILREPTREEADLGEEEKTISGWIFNKALVTVNTPNGDKIIFGEAVESW